MELVNFERVCRTYEEGKEFKENCEKLYDFLLVNNREMTPKEIAETIEFKGWFRDYHPTVQAVTACLQKLKALNLVSRREEETGETIKVVSKGTYGYRNVFDKDGDFLGNAWVNDIPGKEREIKTKKVYYSVKNAWQNK